MSSFAISSSTSSTLLGHKSRCFDIRTNHNDTLVISASEDGTAKIWSSQRKCLRTLKHNPEAEVLRASFIDNSDEIVCTCGSDGVGWIWNSGNKTAILQHETGDQIYACEVVESDGNSATILTAAESKLRLWDVTQPENPQIWSVGSINSSAPAFGGPRNPDNDTYIFDAKPSSTDRKTIALALSDKTIRLVDIRETSLQQIPLMSFSDDNFSLGHPTAVSNNCLELLIFYIINCKSSII